MFELDLESREIENRKKTQNKTPTQTQPKPSSQAQPSTQPGPLLLPLSRPARPLLHWPRPSRLSSACLRLAPGPPALPAPLPGRPHRSGSPSSPRRPRATPAPQSPAQRPGIAFLIRPTIPGARPLFGPRYTSTPSSRHPVSAASSSASRPRAARPRSASAPAQNRRSTTFQPTRAAVEGSLCVQESNPGVPTLGAPSQRLLPELRSNSASAPRLDLAAGPRRRRPSRPPCSSPSPGELQHPLSPLCARFGRL